MNNELIFYANIYFFDYSTQNVYQLLINIFEIDILKLIFVINYFVSFLENTIHGIPQNIFCM